MTDTNGAPSSGADVSGASSSATTKPASAGPPSRSSITRDLKAMKSEKPASEPASPPADTNQPTDALGVDGAATKPEGDTAPLEAGKGEKKPDEKKEPESVPMHAFKERIAKEKARREKVEAEAHTLKGEVAKRDHLLDAMAAENERLAGLLAQAGLYDEKGEELHGIKLQQRVKEELAQKEIEHQQALENLRREAEREAGVKTLVEQWVADIEAAHTQYPLVSRADMKAAIKSDPQIDVRAWAKAEYERRRALVLKQSPTAAATADLPTTVAKPTGVSQFDVPLSAKGMAQALKAARAKR